ncbi:helix-turn-helix domain-containing protein, partial [Actinoplanes sp. NPDC049118]|uniref:AfsR/SARP family transcriptional regulator n=1 Tax=Actinoplanes sp. NPDC049118 TaxID=3155769 RepID=UPI00340D126B
MLALNVNSMTSVDQLVEALWGESPPSTARGQIQSRVWRLRKVFAGAGHPEAIRTCGPGYLLELTPDEVD